MKPAASREAAFAAHLARGSLTPFARGFCDCCLWPADWIAAQRGIDPAADLRGRYRTDLGAERLVRRAGGLVALVADLVGRAGLSETAEPALGDAGVVLDAAGPVMALRGEAGWYAKGPRGLAYAADYPVLRAWSV